MSNPTIPYKIYLNETEMPKAWYNLRADMKVKPAPLLNPGTHEPMKAEELAGVFYEELIKQELDDTTPFLRFPNRSGISIRCTVLPPWSVPTVWKKSCRPRRRSTIEFPEITQLLTDTQPSFSKS